jgi:dTDP-4-dehydrorhamnose 3,5-epimerase
MRITSTEISDILIFEPQVFQDDRGFFYESYNQRAFAEKTGIAFDFVQDNHSCSKYNVLRGLHYQIQQPQGKLVRAIAGTIQDIAVDIRKNSPTFGQWIGCILSAENKCQIWVPPGFAHGFLVLSETAEVVYKTTDYYAPQHERCILWDDPDLAIDWKINTTPIVSAKDRAGRSFKTAEVFP